MSSPRRSGSSGAIGSKTGSPPAACTCAAKEYELELKCRFEMTERKTGRSVDNRTINGTTSFFVSGSNDGSADVNQDERQAIPLAAEDVAIQYVSQISEGW